MNESITYQKILESFGEEKIKLRYQFLSEKYQSYIAKKKIQDDVYINVPLLQQAVLDYFTDIYRLKIFHGIDRVNITKIISYEVYWLLRRKPLQVRNENNDKFKYINENFLTFFLSHEFLYPNDDVMTTEGEKIFLDFLSHISYHLRYRSVEKQNIELMLMAFETGNVIYNEKAKRNQIIEI